MKQKFTKIFSIIMSFLLVIGFVISPNTAYAKENLNTEKVSVNYESLEEELIFIFDTASSFEDGKLFINKELLEEKYGIEMADNIARGGYLPVI